jgi:hypothetical protein
MKNSSAVHGWIIVRSGYEKGLVPKTLPFFKSRAKWRVPERNELSSCLELGLETACT